ncbi:hypothetical protein PINS_up008432 [Pythium insidiosum]|nr:hypothetical protein PINS_up008432 [Pythium insidiosum]
MKAIPDDFIAYATTQNWPERKPEAVVQKIRRSKEDEQASESKSDAGEDSTSAITPKYDWRWTAEEDAILLTFKAHSPQMLREDHDVLIEKMRAPDPSYRPRTFGAMLNRLDRLVRGLVDTTKRPERTRVWGTEQDKILIEEMRAAASERQGMRATVLRTGYHISFVRSRWYRPEPESESEEDIEIIELEPSTSEEVVSLRQSARLQAKESVIVTHDSDEEKAAAPALSKEVRSQLVERIMTRAATAAMESNVTSQEKSTAADSSRRGATPLQSAEWVMTRAAAAAAAEANRDKRGDELPLYGGSVEHGGESPTRMSSESFGVVDQPQPGEAVAVQEETGACLQPDVEMSESMDVEPKSTSDENETWAVAFGPEVTDVEGSASLDEQRGAESDEQSVSAQPCTQEPLTRTCEQVDEVIRGVVEDLVAAVVELALEDATPLAHQELASVECRNTIQPEAVTQPEREDVEQPASDSAVQIGLVNAEDDERSKETVSNADAVDAESTSASSVVVIGATRDEELDLSVDMPSASGGITDVQEVTSESIPVISTSDKPVDTITVSSVSTEDSPVNTITVSSGGISDVDTNTVCSEKTLDTSHPSQPTVEYPVFEQRS